MDTATAAALILGSTGLIGSVLLWLGTRRTNNNVSEADIRKWANELLGKVQEAYRELDNVRNEARALADELRAVRTEAWREDSMPRFREWLARRTQPGKE